MGVQPMGVLSPSYKPRDCENSQVGDSVVAFVYFSIYSRLSNDASQLLAVRRPLLVVTSAWENPQHVEPSK